MSYALRFAVAIIFVTLGSMAGLKPCATVWAQDGWISLFDGKTLNGWTTIGGVTWTVVVGAMSAEPATQ